MRLRELNIKPGTAWDAVASEIDAALRDVRAVLNGGLRLRDQARCVKSVRIVVSELPVTVEIPAGMTPTGVVLLRAVEIGSSSGFVLSGGSVTWGAQAGAVQLHAFSALSSSVYDAVIWIQE